MSEQSPESGFGMNCSRRRAPIGAGVTPIVGIAPALSKAIFVATGVRLTGMPMFMEIVSWTMISLFVLFLLLSIYICAEAYYYQMYLGQPLLRELGFEEGSQYLWVGCRHYSAVAITAVVENGIFAQAGLVAGDVLPGLSHSCLFKRLHRSRGRIAEFEVVSGGPGPSFYDRPRRIVRVPVPPRQGPR